MREKAGRKARTHGTAGDSGCRPWEPGGSRGSSASMLAFPADDCPREEGGEATNQGGGGEKYGSMGVSNAHRVPRAAKKAERKKRRAGVGMQAQGRTRTHGKNDNPRDFEARQDCFRRIFCNSTIGFRSTHLAGRLSRFSASCCTAAVLTGKMVEVGRAVRKQMAESCQLSAPDLGRVWTGQSPIPLQTSCSAPQWPRLTPQAG